jgi:hypothetical protein
MPNIGSLTVELDLQTQQYEAGLKRSKQQIVEHADSLTSLQRTAQATSSNLTAASDEIVAAWGKSGDAAQDAIRKMESISRSSAVNSGIREMKASTDEIVKGWGRVGESGEEAGRRLDFSMREANAALRGVEQLIGVHIPKALEHVITESQLLGPALTAALSGIAIVQFIGLLEQIPALFKKLEDSVSGWDKKAQEAFKNQLASLSELQNQLNDYAAVLDKVKGVGLGPIAAPAQERGALLNQIERQGIAIDSLSQKQRVLQAEADGLKKSWEEATAATIKMGGDVLPKIDSQYKTLIDKVAEYQTQIDAAKNAQQAMLQQLPLVIAQTTEASRKATEEAKKSREEFYRDFQEFNNKEAEFYSGAFMQFKNRMVEGGPAVVEALSGINDWVKDVVKNTEGIAKVNEYWLGQLQAIRNETKSVNEAVSEGEEVAKRMRDAEIAAYKERNKGEDLLEKRIVEDAKKQQEAGRQVASSLTRDFGQFIEHISQAGADFWGSFVRLGLNAIDAVANYAQKMAAAGNAVGGVTGAIASAAPVAGPAFATGFSIGRAIRESHERAEAERQEQIRLHEVKIEFDKTINGTISLLEDSAKSGTLTSEVLNQATENIRAAAANASDWDAFAKTQRARIAAMRETLDQQGMLDPKARETLDKAAAAFNTTDDAINAVAATLSVLANVATRADQAAALYTKQLQKEADARKSVMDTTQSLIDKIVNPAGSTKELEGALGNLGGVNREQIIGAVGEDIRRIGDALTAAGRPIPPFIKGLYDIIKAQDAVTEATSRMRDINDELAGVYDDLGGAMNRQLDRLDAEKASLEGQIVDAENQYAKSQLQDTLDTTSDLGEYIRTQAAMRELDKKIKADKKQADLDDIDRMKKRLKAVTDLQDATNTALDDMGIKREHENDLMDSSITALIERGDKLEKEREALAKVTGATELMTHKFSDLADLFASFSGPATLKSYQHGTDFVPATGAYLLHQGESVTPAGHTKGGGVTVHFNAPVIGDMDELVERLSEPILNAQRYDVQYGSQRPAIRQRAARSNRW